VHGDDSPMGKFVKGFCNIIVEDPRGKGWDWDSFNIQWEIWDCEGYEPKSEKALST